ncbi:unnamed protein product, partial [Mesorhabditis belari]|uniref:SUEL-type lectin domain-containing protein n=1 Tax=Mesorhabditis belari TaxID=2138241 RepID=A0AAF3J2E7_9BILA
MGGSSGRGRVSGTQFDHFLYKNGLTTSEVSEILWSSLAANRVQACDGERVTLHCPRHTHIHVDTGFYGRVVPPSELCPSRRPLSPTPSSSSSLLHSHSLTCDVIHAKAKLSEFCDKRRKCTIVVQASTFEEDPCPGIGKYLQMSYKCRPVSFETASFCEGEQMGIECREGKKLSIQSATWIKGSSDGKCLTESGSSLSKEIQNRGCSRDVLLELLRCHGQSQCSMPLTETQFGKAKCFSKALYSLHVSFVCVNDEIFSEETLKGELDYSLNKKYIEGSGTEWEDVKEERNQRIHQSSIIQSSKRSDEKKRDEKTSSQEKSNSLRQVPIVGLGGLASEKLKEAIEPKEITVEEHIEHSMSDLFSPSQSRGSGPRISEEPPALLSDSAVKPVVEEVAREHPNLVGIAHDVFLITKFFGEHGEETLWVIGIAITLCVCCPLAFCLCLCRASKVKKSSSDGKLRYSIETSQLFAKGSQMLDGPSHLVDIGDLPEETFIRYSAPSTRSTHMHYDF